MPIQKLSPLIANQIAAGEVVERPASVVKELLENSIDAGSTRIQIDLERGGIRLIRITDNGNGIPKTELSLALARHATSKIIEAKDLEAIDTLGFRGEALASISSVSKLTLSSKPQAQDIGWSAHAEGQDMDVKIQPHPLPFGSIVEVKDLFFNTPARQKFLKAERTEFIHIEEIVKKIALANSQIAITLKHNGKVIKRIPAANTEEQIKQRVGTIVGRSFIQRAILLNNELEDLKLSGWLGPIDYHQSSSLSQYFFVNGRPVKDRTISHAVRQAYHELLPVGRSAAFVLFLELPADKLDVNVHPTKHEVRFTDGRRVHDYIIKAIETALDDYANNDILFDRPATNPGMQKFQQETRNEVYEVKPQTNSFQTTGLRINEQKKSYQPKSLSSNKANNQLLFSRFLLHFNKEEVFLLDVKSYMLERITVLLKQEWKQQSIKQKPILIPIRLTIDSEKSIANLVEYGPMLGFDVAQLGPQNLVIKKIPSCIEHIGIQQWLNRVFSKISDLASLQRDLLLTLEQYWQPDEKTQWFDYIQQFNQLKDWRATEFCHLLTEKDILHWLSIQKH